ncbi:MAG: bifunctional alpha,alpha-trehalose-phosphate synthase (UDP-forming)/trehalose-phosphatase [Chloroflexi bacterium]|nr:bifunctional alpha,alpha-trehalose-phosphate synthase (UDP-forming)/trehalose-phosphatase [Chloroflexota bacterium]
MNGLILVSNRLPITIRQSRTGEQAFVQSDGGLVAGLRPVHKRGGQWVGYPGEEPTSKVRRALIRKRLIPVPLSASEYRSYYLGYANSAIWPLFHYLIDRCVFRPEAYRAYHAANERFADEVAARARKKDQPVWVHDYQLMLLPRMLRERLPDARIGFFLHIPFPSAEVFRVLPQREEILRGLLGADLIGVHTYDYAQNLTNSLRRFLGLEARDGVVRVENRQVRIHAQAMGVDVKGLRNVAYSRRVDRRLKTLRKTFRGRKVILGVDRLDYTKGLPLKLAAFRRLLETVDEWRGRAVMVQVAVPTRRGIESYREQKDEVERLVGEINGLFGAPGQVPIHYQYGSVSQEELAALYRLADVCIVTPLRDGLNLVAKEYVACHDSDGVLVLSEFAGAASELGEAIRVNPWDVEGTAEDLERALRMDPAVSRERMGAMHSRVAANDIHRWADDLLRPLTEPAEGRLLAGPPLLEPEVLSAAIGPEFAAASRALIVLDYDGTVREFTPRFEDAVPTAEIRQLLEKLGTLEDVQVFINSGRDRVTLDAWFGAQPVSLIAEHGAWLRYMDSSTWTPLRHSGPAAWKDRVIRVMNDYVARTPGARIEEKETSLVWHYREAPADLGAWQALQLTSLLEQMLAQSPVEVVVGARIVEVREQGVDKGRAYAAVVEAMGPFQFVLVAGDDETDEDLFLGVGAHGYSVRVGTGGTHARAAVESPAALRKFLADLLEQRAKVRTGSTRTQQAT